MFWGKLHILRETVGAAYISACLPALALKVTEDKMMMMAAQGVVSRCISQYWS